MQIQYIPLLQTARDLLDTPRGMERFKQYLATILGDGDDVALMPLVAMNPLSREHIAERLDQLLALDADLVAARAAFEAARDLDLIDGLFKLGLVVMDDRHGGWTNRYTSDFAGRVGNSAAIKRRWINVGLWVSEAASIAATRAAVRAAIFRTAYMLRHGYARTLRHLLAQESLAAAFSGSDQPQLNDDELRYSRDLIAPLLDTSIDNTPIVLACLYGDAAAYELGYPQLGLPDQAGLIVGAAAARAYLRRINQTAQQAIDADVAAIISD